jgi:hypothetical protein
LTPTEPHPRSPRAGDRATGNLPPDALVLHAALSGLADADGCVSGISLNGLAQRTRIGRGRIRHMMGALTDAGVVLRRDGDHALFPHWIVHPLDPGEPVAPAVATAFARTEGQRRAANRRACNRALAALLKHHGDNPPDGDAALAVARIRSALAGRPA